MDSEHERRPLWMWIGEVLARPEMALLALAVGAFFALVAAFFTFVLALGTVERISGSLLFHDFGRVMIETAFCAAASTAIAVWALRIWRTTRRLGEDDSGSSSDPL